MAESMGTEPLVCVADFEREAKRRLAKQVYDYYASGANQEISLRQNKLAFSRLLLRWRSLRCTDVDMSTTVQGQRIAMPVCVAPTAMQRMAHADGEVATARACGKLGTVMTLSSWATSSVEQVAAGAPDTLRWFQLYVYKDRVLTRRLVERAEREGFKAIALTVDAPRLGKRYADERNRFSLPNHLTLANFDASGSHGAGVKSSSTSGLAAYVASLIDPTLSWKDIAWLRSITRLPIIVKGIMTAEDAREAVRHGVDGIWVSNHGARQLDTTPATIEVLPEVVQAAAGRCEVYVDGGVRCSTDVLKALALGARAVFVGRPAVWGLAVGGERGVQRVLEILRDELSLAMLLCGCPSVEDIPRGLVVHQSRFRSRL